MSRNRRRIETVFGELEKRGIIARADFSCCNGCGSGEIFNRELPGYQEKNGPEHQPIGYLFFHEQDTDAANDGYRLHLRHGSISEADDALDQERVHADQILVAGMVIEELREHGFQVEWDGNTWSTIQVLEPDDGWNLDYDRSQDEDEDEEWDDH